MSGELRVESLAVLEANVDLLGSSTCDRVVVDVSAVTDIDAVGLNVLVGLHHYMLARGGTLGVSGASPAVASMLDGSEVARIPDRDPDLVAPSAP